MQIRGNKYTRHTTSHSNKPGSKISNKTSKQLCKVSRSQYGLVKKKLAKCCISMLRSYVISHGLFQQHVKCSFQKIQVFLGCKQNKLVKKWPEYEIMGKKLAFFIAKSISNCSIQPKNIFLVQYLSIISTATFQ